MTSAARLVLSETNPLTNNAGMVITSANPHTTISFIPMDLDLNLACKPGSNIEASFMYFSRPENYFALQS
jgi:hypothetical protein